MIEQQYYTRARKGIFSNSPGYDTIARSSGLTDTFIKNVLHPYCIYDVPSELIGSSGVDKSLYPDCITFFTSDSGKAVVGRSCFAGADYTGMRDTYFVHNLVFDENDSEQLIKDPDKLFSIGVFKNNYNIDEGESLENLSNFSELNCFENNNHLSFNETLSVAGISEAIFKRIILALFKSSFNKKKVYVSLNLNSSDFSNVSKSLTKYLLLTLPLSVRKNIGFSTFAPQPKNKKNINILFIEKGGLRLNDPEITREYVFDLSRDRLLNVEFNERSNYIESILSMMIKSDWSSIKDVHNLLEILSEVFDKEENLSVESYNNLINIVELLQSGSISNYDNIPRLIDLVYRILVNKTEKSKYIVSKIENKNSFKYLLDIIENKVLSDEEILTLIDIFNKCDEKSESNIQLTTKIKTDIKNTFINMLNKLNTDFSEESFYLIDKIRGTDELFESVMNDLTEKRDFLLSNYVSKKISTVKNIEELESVLSNWNRYYNHLNSDIIYFSIKEASEALLNKSENMLVDRINLYTILKEYLTDVYYIAELEQHIFKDFKLIDVSVDEVKKLKHLKYFGDEGILCQIKILIKIDESPELYEREICEEISKLGDLKRNELFQTIKKFYIYTEENFSKTSYLFLSSTNRGSSYYNNFFHPNTYKVNYNLINLLLNNIMSSEKGLGGVIRYLNFLAKHRRNYGFYEDFFEEELSKLIINYNLYKKPEFQSLDKYLAGRAKEIRKSNRFINKIINKIKG